jgi:hypothetical protein
MEQNPNSSLPHRSLMSNRRQLLKHAAICESVSTDADLIVLCHKLENPELPLEDWIQAQEKLIDNFIFSANDHSPDRAACAIHEAIKQKVIA